MNVFYAFAHAQKLNVPVNMSLETWKNFQDIKKFHEYFTSLEF